jgi:hypothetical protein
MDSTPLRQKLIVYTLWLASGITFATAFYFQRLDHQQSSATLADSLKPVSQVSETIETSSHYTPGLFGIAQKEIVTSDKKPKTKVAVPFGPKSLEGVFIQDNKAYALVTDSSNQYQIIPPESITAHNKNSVTIQTAQGVKSLHIQHNRSGLEIRQVKKRRPEKSGVGQKEEISEADKIRLRLLRKE